MNMIIKKVTICDRRKNLAMILLMVLILSTTIQIAFSEPSATTVMANDKLKFGSGDISSSITPQGTLLQPFYFDPVLKEELGGEGWYQLTFSNYPLNSAIAVGGDGTNEWNLNGTVSPDPVLSNMSIDQTNYTATSPTTGFGTLIVTGEVTLDGKLVEIQHKYTLGETSSFVKIESKITNKSDSTLENLRFWVGTQDDFVGVSDSPTKERGNLINGEFQLITSSEQKSSALRITSEKTGVLFYTTSPIATTYIRPGYTNFNTVVSQDPYLTPVTRTSDDSYALFIRLNNLGVNESQSFIWYYAAGNIDSLTDVVTEVGEEAEAETATVPEPPSNVNAIAGNESVTLTFDIPTNNGGAEITGYRIESDPGNISVISVSNLVTFTGLTNGVTYSFKVYAINSKGESVASIPSNQVTPIAPVEPAPTPLIPDEVVLQTEPIKPTNPPVTVLVNGKEEAAGSEIRSKEGNLEVVTISLNQDIISNRIDTLINQNTELNQTNILQIPFVKGNADKVNIGLIGNIVKKLEENDFKVNIEGESVSYEIPASALNVLKTANEMGVSLERLSDIEFFIEITEPSMDSVKMYELIAQEKGYELIVPPLSFEIKAVSKDVDGKEVNTVISKFNTFVPRTIKIPGGVDPSKITTGIVLNDDGSIDHVPTNVFNIDGVWYAKINSLTNSTYSVIWNPVQVASVSNHWSKESVNDLASRKVILEYEGFEPDRVISRGEFVSYVVKALGIFRTNEIPKQYFKDVKVTDEFALAISSAYEYGLVSGYGDGVFRSNEAIDKDEAVAIIIKALHLTGVEVNAEEIDNHFVDANDIDSWAKHYIEVAFGSKIITGNTNHQINATLNLKSSEATVMIRNLLMLTELVNK